MRWVDDAILISLHTSGESGKVATVFSKEYGRWSGFFNSDSAKINLGDICNVVWTSRVPDSLGRFKFEQDYSAFQFHFRDNVALLSIQSICELLITHLADHDAHSDLYDVTKNCLMNISPKEYAIWELHLLKYIGYGLDLSRCAVSGASENLRYISPKTGHCVTEEVGAIYKDKLFVIPDFWINPDAYTDQDVLASLKITGFFLTKIWNDRGMFYRSLLYSELSQRLANTHIVL